MAKVTQPLGSSEARGSVGGYTYNTWRGLHTVKTRSGPKALPSQKMLDLLALTRAATLAWQALDQPTRDRWNQWAADQRFPCWTGQDRRITGYNWFVKCYVTQARLYPSIDMVLPIDPVYHTLTNPRLTYELETLELRWDWYYPRPPVYYMVEAWAHNPPSAARQPYIKQAIFANAAAYSWENVSWYCPQTGPWDVWFRLARPNGRVGTWEHRRIIAED